MASLGVRIYYFLSIEPTVYNPRPLQYLYKPEGLDRRKDHNIDRLAKLGFSHYDLEVDQLLYPLYSLNIIKQE